MDSNQTITCNPCRRKGHNELHLTTRSSNIGFSSVKESELSKVINIEPQLLDYNMYNLDFSTYYQFLEIFLTTSDLTDLSSSGKDYEDLVSCAIRWLIRELNSTLFKDRKVDGQLILKREFMLTTCDKDTTNFSGPVEFVIQYVKDNHVHLLMVVEVKKSNTYSSIQSIYQIMAEMYALNRLNHYTSIPITDSNRDIDNYSNEEKCIDIVKALALGVHIPVYGILTDWNSLQLFRLKYASTQYETTTQITNNKNQLERILYYYLKLSSQRIINAIHGDW